MELRLLLILIFLSFGKNTIAYNIRHNQVLIESQLTKSNNVEIYSDKITNVVIAKCDPDYKFSHFFNLSKEEAKSDNMISCAATDKYNHACWVKYVGYVESRPAVEVCYANSYSSPPQCRIIPILKDENKNEIDGFIAYKQSFQYYDTGYEGKIDSEMECPKTENNINAAGYVFVKEAVNELDCSAVNYGIESQINESLCPCKSPECIKNSFMPPKDSDLWKKANNKTKQCYSSNKKLRLAKFYCEAAKKCINPEIKAAYKGKDESIVNKLYGIGNYICVERSDIKCGCAKMIAKGGPRHFLKIARNDNRVDFDCSKNTVALYPQCNLFVNLPSLRPFKDEIFTTGKGVCTKEWQAENGPSYRGTFFKPKGILSFGRNEMYVHFANKIDNSDEGIRKAYDLKAASSQIPHIMTSNWNSEIYVINYAYEVQSSGNCLLKNTSQKAYVAIRLETNMRDHSDQLVAYAIETTDDKPENFDNDGIVLDIKGNIKKMLIQESDFISNSAKISSSDEDSLSYSDKDKGLVSFNYKYADNIVKSEQTTLIKKKYIRITRIGSVPRPVLKYFYDGDKEISPTKIEIVADEASTFSSDIAWSLKLSVNPSITVKNSDSESLKDLYLPTQQDETLIISQFNENALKTRQDASGKVIFDAVVQNNRSTFLFGHYFAIDLDPCYYLSSFRASEYLTSPLGYPPDCNKIQTKSKQLACITSAMLVQNCNRFVGCQVEDETLEDCYNSDIRIPKIKMYAASGNEESAAINLAEYKHSKDFRTKQLICITEGISVADIPGKKGNTDKFGLFGKKEYDYVVSFSRNPMADPIFTGTRARPLTYRGLNSYTTEDNWLDTPEQIIPITADYFETKDNDTLIKYLKSIFIKDELGNNSKVSVLENYFPECVNNKTDCSNKISFRQKDLTERRLGPFCAEITKNTGNTWIFQTSRRSQVDYTVYVPLRCQLLKMIAHGAGGAGMTEEDNPGCMVSHLIRHPILQIVIGERFIRKYSATGGGGAAVEALLPTRIITDFPSFLPLQIGERTFRCYAKAENALKLKCYDWHRLDSELDFAGKPVTLQGGCHSYRKLFDSDEDKSDTANIDPKENNPQSGSTIVWLPNNVLPPKSTTSYIISAGKGGSPVDLMIEALSGYKAGLINGVSDVPQYDGNGDGFGSVSEEMDFTFNSNVMNAQNRDITKGVPKYNNNLSLYSNIWFVAGHVSLRDGARSELCDAEDSFGATAKENEGYCAEGSQCTPTDWETLKDSTTSYNIFNQHPGTGGSFYGGGSFNSAKDGITALNENFKSMAAYTEAGGKGWLKIEAANIAYDNNKNPIVSPDGYKYYNLSGNKGATLSVDRKCKVRCPPINVIYRQRTLNLSLNYSIANADLLCEYSGKPEDDMEAVVGRLYSPKKCYIISKNLVDGAGKNLYGKIIRTQGTCPIVKCKNKAYDLSDLGNNHYDIKYSLCYHSHTQEGKSDLYFNMVSDVNSYSGMSFEGSLTSTLSSNNPLAPYGKRTALLAECTSMSEESFLFDTIGGLKAKEFILRCGDNGFWVFDNIKEFISENLSNTSSPLIQKIKDRVPYYGNIQSNDQQYAYKNEYKEIELQAQYTDYSILRRYVHSDKNPTEKTYACPPLSHEYDYDKVYSGFAVWDHALEQYSVNAVSCMPPNLTTRYIPSKTGPAKRICKHNGIFGPVENPCGATCPQELSSGAIWSIPDTILNYDPQNSKITVKGKCLSNAFNSSSQKETTTTRVCDLQTGTWDAAPLAQGCSNFTGCFSAKSSYRAPFVNTISIYQNQTTPINDLFLQVKNQINSDRVLNESNLYFEFEQKTDTDLVNKKNNILFEQAVGSIEASYEDNIILQLQSGCQDSRYCNKNKVQLIDGSCESEKTQNTTNQKKYILLKFNNITQTNLFPQYLIAARELNVVDDWLLTLQYDNKNYTGEWRWDCGLSRQNSQFVTRKTSTNQQLHQKDITLMILIAYSKVDDTANIEIAEKISLFSPYLAKQYIAQNKLSYDIKAISDVRFRIVKDVKIFQQYPFLIYYSDRGYSEKLYSLSWSQNTQNWDENFTNRTIARNCNSAYAGSIKHNSLKHIMYTPTTDSQDIYFASLYCYDGVIYGYYASKLNITLDNKDSNIDCYLRDANLDEISSFRCVANNVKFECPTCSTNNNHFYKNTRIASFLMKYWSQYNIPNEPIKTDFENQYPNLNNQTVSYVLSAYKSENGNYSLPVKRQASWIFGKGEIMNLGDFTILDNLDPYCKTSACKDYGVSVRQCFGSQWQMCDSIIDNDNDEI
jgi:hypothetical protein